MKKKIKRSVSRRFKITKTGKVMFSHQYGQHHFAVKSGSRKRRLKEPAVLARGFAKKIKKMMGYL